MDMMFLYCPSRMYRRSLNMVIAMIALLTASCAPLDTAYIPATPSQTPPPTSTIVWFPPSATPTAQAVVTKEPTPEMRPGVSGTVLNDSFSRAELWDTATSDQASAEIFDNQLNIAVQSSVFMFSLRHDFSADNFYAEVTARPNLCRGEDSYGMLVRASAVAYYRFSLSCNGTASAERDSLRTRSPLQEPLPSGDVPPGAPGEVRIGVWASGREMRLFLNGRYQFSITDANYAAGTVGVFVQSNSDTPAVVSFSDLSIQGVDYAPPIPTPTP